MACCRNVDLGKCQVVDDRIGGSGNERLREAANSVAVAFNNTSKVCNRGIVATGINVIIYKEVLVGIGGKLLEVADTIDTITYAGDDSHGARR